MPSPTLRVLVVIFWAGMTGWLVQREVLSRVLTGPAPDFRSVVAKAAQDNSRPVRWTVFAGEEEIGRAETAIAAQPEGGYLLSSTATLRKLPLWLPLQEAIGQPLGLESNSTFSLSPDGTLREFQIHAKLNGLEETLTVNGHVEDGSLHAVVGLGTYRDELVLPYSSQGLVLDAFSPPDRLPELRVGQTWQVPMINPLTRQIDILEARVARRDFITWGHQAMAAFVVEQQAPGGLTARCWVRPDGLVVRQEVPMIWTSIRFEREPSLRLPDP